MKRPMGEGRGDETGVAQLEKWLSIGGRVIAPTTALTTLLFYFGYVSSRAQYDYFGVDVDVVGLTTQDYVMRSPQPLLVPVLVLTLLTAALLAADSAVRRRMTSRPPARTWFRTAVAVGLTLLTGGTLLLLAYPPLSGWEYYPLVTPLVFAVGGALTGYSLSMHQRSQATASGSRTTVVLLWVAAVAGLFWATATVAEWSGRGLGQQQARNLSDLPSVILDTQERLFLPSASGVEELTLGAATDERAYRYRYWKLRLLIQGDDHMFLVPNTWSAGNTTLMVPLDERVRVQFQFRNLSP